LVSSSLLDERSSKRNDTPFFTADVLFGHALQLYVNVVLSLPLPPSDSFPSEDDQTPIPALLENPRRILQFALILQEKRNLHGLNYFEHTTVSYKTQPSVISLRIHEEYVRFCVQGWSKYQKGQEAAVKRLEREEEERLLLSKDGIDRTVEDQAYRMMIKDREMEAMDKLGNDLLGESFLELCRTAD